VLSRAVILDIGSADPAGLTLYTGSDCFRADRVHLSLVPVRFHGEALCGAITMMGSTANEAGEAKGRWVSRPDCAVRVRALRSRA
jgi:hypothetical protein